MKTFRSKATFMAALFVIMTTAKSQTYIPVCGMTDTTSTSLSAPLPNAGLSIPSLTGDNEYRVLVLWVRFADDSAKTADWQDYTTLPAWAVRMVDTVKSAIDDHGLNISSYYRRNSFKRSNLVDNVRLVTLDSAEALYHIYRPNNITSARTTIA